VLGLLVEQVFAAANPEADLLEPSLVSIVDDDESFRNSMRRLLESHGYAVAVFPSAGEFLASDLLPATACLVTDVHMPIMTGVELFEYLIATGRVIPTILITAHVEEGVRQRMMVLGAGCYLHKPLDEVVLMDCLRSAFPGGSRPQVGP
jgi:FixJ family two-component response regulator